MGKIPSRLQGILWSASVNQLDLEGDKVYIIHQILMYGGFEDIKWLFKTYPQKTIKEIFVTRPLKVYTKEGFHFVKNYVLDFKGQKLPVGKYVNPFYEHP